MVSAIANQTKILKNCVQDVKSGSLSGGTNLTCSYALKWVSHFLGDIAQPLHASERAAGGNFYRVRFGNVSTELHAVSTCTFYTTERALKKPRYLTATFPILQPASPNPFRIKPSPPFSKAWCPVSERISSIVRRTCGWHAATRQRRWNVQRAGLVKATSGRVITSTARSTTPRISPRMDMPWEVFL